MNVNSYLFQSPYHNQTQVGRVDPSATQDKSSVNQTKEMEDRIIQDTKEAQKIEASKATQNSDFRLDLYA